MCAPESSSDSSSKLEAALSSGDASAVSNRELQRLLAFAMRAYAAKVEGGDRFPPFEPADGVTATDVVTCATAMLDAAEIAVFELGMWQAVSGRS